MAYSKRALFSIIIPVYNAQSTIIRLLTSIKKQKFDDYEVVMVIDGATDNSERVIKEFIIQNNLMNTWSCYTQNNSGVSAARNYGMSIAKGRYILFCDADDVVDLDLMNCISQKIADDAEKDDIIFFGKTNIKNGNIDSIDTISETKTVKIGAEYFEKLLKNNLLPTTWNKAIRRSFVGKTIFKDIPAGEDYEFYLDLLMKKPCISIINRPLYYYDTSSENSIMHSYHPERTKTFIRQKEKVNQLLGLFQADEETLRRINFENNADCLDRIVTNLFREGVHVPLSLRYQELKNANKYFPICGEFMGNLARSKRVKVKLAGSINPGKFAVLVMLYMIKDHC